jgi:hypothetical protein
MTIRSKTDLLNNLPDNIIGDISPEDVRDVVETMNPAFGSLYVSTPAQTVINTVNVWEKVAGVTTAVNLNRFDMPADNRLRYIGSPNIHCFGKINFSGDATGNNKTFELAAFHDGSILTHSIIQRFYGNYSISAVHFDVQLAQNGYIELFARNINDDTNLDIGNMYMLLIGAFI